MENQARLRKETIDTLLDLLEISETSNTLYENQVYRPQTVITIEDLVGQVMDIDVAITGLMVAGASAADLESRVIKVDTIEFSPIQHGARLDDYRSQRSALLSRLRALTGWGTLKAVNSYSSYGN
jgi:hypothetical protein